MSQEIYLKPCPFCGESGPEISEGSTHRWMQISCCGEVRKADIMLPASHPVNMKLAAEVWNTRSARSEASAWVSVAELVDAVEAVLLVVDRKTDAVDRLKVAVANVKSQTDVGTEKLSRQLEIAMQCVSECEQRSGCQNHSKIKEMS